MTILTTPKAVLIGFFLIALSIASLPYSIKPANAELYGYDVSGIEGGLYAIASSINMVAMSI